MAGEVEEILLVWLKGTLAGLLLPWTLVLDSAPSAFCRREGSFPVLSVRHVGSTRS